MFTDRGLSDSIAIFFPSSVLQSIYETASDGRTDAIFQDAAQGAFVHKYLYSVLRGSHACHWTMCGRKWQAVYNQGLDWIGWSSTLKVSSAADQGEWDASQTNDRLLNSRPRVCTGDFENEGKTRTQTPVLRYPSVHSYRSIYWKKISRQHLSGFVPSVPSARSLLGLLFLVFHSNDRSSLVFVCWPNFNYFRPFFLF